MTVESPNKIFALDQSLPSFQGKQTCLAPRWVSLLLIKISGRGYLCTMSPGRLIHCKSSGSGICICNWSENNNLFVFFFHMHFYSLEVCYLYILQEGTYIGNFVWQRHDNFVVIFYVYLLWFRGRRLKDLHK